MDLTPFYLLPPPQPHGRTNSFFGPDNNAIEMFRITRSRQYTTAYDATQIFFFNVARNVSCTPNCLP